MFELSILTGLSLNGSAGLAVFKDGWRADHEGVHMG